MALQSARNVRLNFYVAEKEQKYVELSIIELIQFIYERFYLHARYYMKCPLFEV